ncbi:MAG: FxsA family protein [Alphaproteobacteria bacterium]
MPFFLLFMLFPILELWIFVKVTGEVGFFLALTLLLLSAMTGGALVRHQGFRTVLSMHDAMERGKMPLDALFDEFCIVAAGILLIFPGFISDGIAILLLVPRLRTVLRGFVRKHPDWHSSESIIIEGEYERVEDDPKTLS